MIGFHINAIAGMMVGLEFLTDNVDEDIKWAVVLDLFILRFALIKYRDE